MNTDSLMRRYLIILLLIIFPFLLIKDLPLMWVRYSIATIIVAYLFYQTFTIYDFRQLGFFKPTKWDYFYFALASIFALLLPFLILRLPNFCPPEPLGFSKETPAWLLLSIYGLINAIGQEVIYRSFLINHLESVLRNKTLILIIGAVLFSLLHTAWGVYFIFASLLVGAYFVWWFMHTRNIVLITVLHIPMTIFVIYTCFV